jgi:NADP-dependent 3-hydroxy acid dehydrogenase YdfG
MNELTGRTVVITGASSGIGEATAHALSAMGADVALLARRTDRMEKLAGDLQGDGKTITIAADVTDRESMRAAADRVQVELGGADILINSAGQMLLGPFGPDQADETRRMIETNLLGSMTALEVFLDQLKDGGGDLVNISSVAGRTASAGSSVYNATKWGINGWSEALRQELQGDDIRVIVIEPGAVDTELTDHITNEQSKAGAQKMYSETAIPPEDVADVIAFAVSRPARTSLNEIIVRPTKQLH